MALGIPPRARAEGKQHQERAKVTSAQSVQQQTELIKITHNAHESQRQEEEEVVDGEEEEQRRRAIEGVVDITVLCLKQLKQEELADSTAQAFALSSVVVQVQR
ncbi:hypothetical protein N1851_013022 [Merluccius polli]|uniref:Uncharacterized protein n=1 Tax=Merluccius polli TaxID=89951 RepID=A0AA47P404_MERPO|nr:hypothetical protein N1851_013022 [Merluccius polli]